MKNLLLTATTVLGFATATLAQVPNYVPTNGLVGWWPFNGNANDESGNGNNGTVNGAILTEDRFGNANEAYSFDGVDDKILVMNPINIPIINSDYTFSTWINNTGNNNGSIIWYGNIVNNGCNALRLSQDGCSNNQLGIYGIQNYWWNNDIYYCSDNPNEFPQNTWINVAVTYDGLNRKIFINGIMKNVMSISQLMSVSTISELLFGWFPYYDYYGFNGQIDDIGIWNRELTQEEITNLYNGNICFETVTVTDTLLINMGIVGYNPISYSNTIKIFPNPSNDHITINYGDFASLNGYQLRIDNSLGQQMFQTAINQQSSYISLSTWTGNGLYFVHIIDPQGNTIDIRKIVLQ
ncbi:MAG: LamG-like jellyroll fold domain-containing protein [Bacteroidia bacterium]